MSNEEERKIVNELFLRAAKDTNFRRELLEDPLKVLSKYNLSTKTINDVVDALRTDVSK